MFDVPARIRRRWNFSADAVPPSIEDSLQRLQLDKIDIVCVHDPDDHYREVMEGAFPTLDRLRPESDHRLRHGHEPN